MSEQIVTVWFAGACPLCRREIAWLQRLDRAQRIRFVDVSPPDAACPLDRTVLLERLHARTGDGEILVGVAAFAAMWRAIPALRPLGHAAGLPPVARVLGAAYAAFLRWRPWLQRAAARVLA